MISGWSYWCWLTGPLPLVDRMVDRKLLQSPYSFFLMPKVGKLRRAHIEHILKGGEIFKCLLQFIPFANLLYIHLLKGDQFDGCLFDIYSFFTFLNISGLPSQKSKKMLTQGFLIFVISVDDINVFLLLCIWPSRYKHFL